MSNQTKKCGVYRITNIINGKYYIGASTNINHRWSTHKSHLRNGRHFNQEMIQDYRLYGETSFDFQILTYCKRNELEKYESALLNLHVTNDQCYNKSLNTYIPTQETAEKISEAHQGRKHTKIQRKKMSISHSQKTLSQTHRQNIGLANSKSIKVTDENGNEIIYNSLKELIQDLNISAVTLRRYVKGEEKRKRRKYNDWKFEWMDTQETLIEKD